MRLVPAVALAVIVISCPHLLVWVDAESPQMADAPFASTLQELEEKCEKPEVTQEECLAKGPCCEWDDGSCWAQGGNPGCLPKSEGQPAIICASKYDEEQIPFYFFHALKQTFSDVLKRINFDLTLDMSDEYDIGIKIEAAQTHQIVREYCQSMNIDEFFRDLATVFVSVNEAFGSEPAPSSSDIAQMLNGTDDLLDSLKCEDVCVPPPPLPCNETSASVLSSCPFFTEALWESWQTGYVSPSASLEEFVSVCAADGCLDAISDSGCFRGEDALNMQSMCSCYAKLQEVGKGCQDVLAAAGVGSSLYESSASYKGNSNFGAMIWYGEFNVSNTESKEFAALKALEGMCDTIEPSVCIAEMREFDECKALESMINTIEPAVTDVCCVLEAAEDPQCTSLVMSSSVAMGNHGLPYSDEYEIFDRIDPLDTTIKKIKDAGINTWGEMLVRVRSGACSSLDMAALDSCAEKLSCVEDRMTADYDHYDYDYNHEPLLSTAIQEACDPDQCGRAVLTECLSFDIGLFLNFTRTPYMRRRSQNLWGLGEEISDTMSEDDGRIISWLHYMLERPYGMEEEELETLHSMAEQMHAKVCSEACYSAIDACEPSLDHYWGRYLKDNTRLREYCGAPPAPPSPAPSTPKQPQDDDIPSGDTNKNETGTGTKPATPTTPGSPTQKDNGIDKNRNETETKTVTSTTIFSDLNTVDDFTEALQNQFIARVAELAGVNKTNVAITEIAAGSVIVTTLIKFDSANVDTMIDSFKEKIASPETLTEVFGNDFGTLEMAAKECTENCDLKQPLETPSDDSSAPDVARIRFVLGAFAIAALASHFIA